MERLESEITSIELGRESVCPSLGATVKEGNTITLIKEVVVPVHSSFLFGMGSMAFVNLSN